jgi:hypothetical protein
MNIIFITRQNTVVDTLLNYIAIQGIAMIDSNYSQVQVKLESKEILIDNWHDDLK